ncbi:MAG: manganese efflux pump MntP family protein [Candidatus Kapabacteria bacterium]|jgi:putative Mn2+ efflux pump MntP|nr:manganese efflux pump MntP family protein [Candidatus Kapabacteria bacterium]
MDLLYIIFIAFALAVDAFSLSIAAGASMKSCDRRSKFRLSFHVGLFHFILPVAGYFAGAEFVEFISDYDHWIAFGLLSLVGGKMIADSRKEEETIKYNDISKGIALITVTLATSIDALAVGFTYGITNSSVIIPALIFAFVTGSVTMTGMYIGEKISLKFNKAMPAVAGVVLILIGLHIVADHMHLI